jgi:hypothetical protein
MFALDPIRNNKRMAINYIQTNKGEKTAKPP